MSVLLPGKRGPRYAKRRCPAEIEQLVLAERANGCNRYEIYSILKPLLNQRTPAPSTIYAVLRRNGQNRLETRPQNGAIQDQSMHEREAGGAGLEWHLAFYLYRLLLNLTSNLNSIMRFFLFIFFLIGGLGLPTHSHAEESKESLTQRVMGLIDGALAKPAPPLSPPEPPNTLTAPPNPVQETPPELKTQINTQANTQAPSSAPPPQSTLTLARNYLPIYPRTDTDNNTGNDETADIPPQLLPFYASAPLNKNYAGITRLIVTIHDADRDAAKHFSFLNNAQKQAAQNNPDGFAGRSFIFAPQFLRPEDLANLNDSISKSILRWPLGGWAMGANSLLPPSDNVFAQTTAYSSFDIMDYLLLVLGAPRFFPDLREIIVVGYGTGADFTQRYAGLGKAPALLRGAGIASRFVLIQPQSYLYFDARRADMLEGEAERCPAFNRYPYGLDDLPAYGAAQGGAAIRLAYGAQNVRLLVASNAVRELVDASPQACALRAQGKNFVTRAQNFMAHLTRLYGDEAMTQTLSLIPEIPDNGLNPEALLTSPCAQTTIFGDGLCAE